MHKGGISVVEIMIAIAVFLLFSISILKSVTYSYRTMSYDKQYSKALIYSQQGLEVVRQLRDYNWNDLSSGDFGILFNENINEWTLVADPVMVNGFTTTIFIENVYRDSSENISEDGETLDGEILKVTSTVSYEWMPDFPKEVVTSAYLANIR